MVTKKFELWLDESGDFKNDSNTTKNPSLVGGILLEKGTLGTKQISKILGSNYIHSNEIEKAKFGEYAVQVLTDVVEGGSRLVVFENQERLEIVNDSTTYLNVMSEGIIQLLQLLSAEYGYIELDILVAVRLDMEKQYYRPGEIINKEEYILRLKEKITMGLARRTLSNYKKYKWNIEMASARKDHRLMIVDVVCNTFLTKGSKKFDDKQREQLEKLYIEKYLFTVFERSTPTHIKRLIADGSIGEAIFELFTTEEKLNKEELLAIAVSRLSMVDDEGRKVQLLNIKNRIGALIKVDSNYTKSKKILLKIQDELIPLLTEKHNNINIFILDIHLYLFTIYTHEGSVLLAEKQMQRCQAIITKLKNRWESIDYYFMLKIREAVHLMNTFDYTKAVEMMDGVSKALDETMGLFTLVEGLDELYQDIKSDLMGKAVGTRLQARRYMIRDNKEQLALALEDSDRAIKEFMHDSDKTRQYQYRSEIECEGGKYKQALDYLCKSMGVSYQNEDSMVELLKTAMDKPIAAQLYSIMHYTRIMAEAKIAEQNNLAESMQLAWDKVKLGSSELISDPGSNHPYQIIFWKLGSFMAKEGNTAASIKYYNEAIKICNLKPEQLTLRAIGLGIMAEKAATLGNSSKKFERDFNSATRDFINAYENFIKTEMPSSMYNIFTEWKPWVEQINVLSTTADKADLLWKLSRKITY